jgi:CRP/FNR family transcriptional regulator, cyclic AMP receptor protein
MSQAKSTIELLAAVPLFTGLTEETLTRLSEVMRPQRLSQGQTLFFQGDPGDHLYVIRSGEVKLILPGPEGQESVLEVLQSGDFFGEMALFDERPRSAEVAGVQATALLSLHRDDFRGLIHRYPEMAFPIFRALCDRLRRTTDLLEESLFLDLPARLARVLLRLARDYGSETPTGIHIGRPFTHQEIAEMVGATRPRVSEHLQRLRRLKILGGDNRGLDILRPDALKQLAG